VTVRACILLKAFAVIGLPIMVNCPLKTYLAQFCNQITRFLRNLVSVERN